MRCPHCGKDTDLPSLGLREAGEAPAPQATIESEFANWYSFYPRKVGRGAARTAYGRARKKTDAQTLLDGCSRYARLVEGREARFVCLPATWLNQERWADGEDITKIIPPDHMASVSHVPPTWKDEEAHRLTDQIPLAAFNAWFYPAQITARNPVTIAFPSEFKRNWVETHYQFQLKRAFGTYRLEVIS